MGVKVETRQLILTFELTQWARFLATIQCNNLVQSLEVLYYGTSCALNVALCFLVKAWLWNKLVTRVGVTPSTPMWHTKAILSSSLSLKMWKIKQRLRLTWLVFGALVRCFIRWPFSHPQYKLIPPFTCHDRSFFTGTWLIGACLWFYNFLRFF
jgi:hypothetical protein